MTQKAYIHILNTVLDYSMIVSCPKINILKKTEIRIGSKMETHSKQRMAPKWRQTKQVLLKATPTYNKGHAEAISQQLPGSHKKNKVYKCKSFSKELHVCKSFYVCAIFNIQTNKM